MGRFAIHASLAVLLALLAPAVAAAQVDANMYNAQTSLEAAVGQLQASPYEYGGHRRKALEHVRRALQEMRAAELAPPSGKQEKQELKRERRALKQEEKQERREGQLEHKQLRREEQLEERGH